MTVWVVLTIWSNEDCCRDSHAIVFSNYADVEEHFNQLIEDTKVADYFDADSYKIYEGHHYWLAEQSHADYIEYSIERAEVK